MGPFLIANPAVRTAWQLAIVLPLCICSAIAAIMSDSAFKDGSGKYIFRGDIHTAFVSLA